MIPVNTPDLSGKEKQYLIECIETGWISSEGPFIRRLEEGLARRMNRAHGIAVCNGSVALDVAVAALGLGPGDEVIMPSFTIISCALAIVRAGATPVFVDSDPQAWTMNVSDVAARITSRTRAIMAVHIYGLPVDMDPLLALAKKHNLKVIEDAAEAIGQTYRGRVCGSFGDISTVSFYPNKHITTGEGGMVLTDDAELAERCRDLRNLCFGRKRRFVHESLGWNFRMSNVQAAIGVAQMERLDATLEKKRYIGRRYAERLKGCPGVQQPLPATDYAENIYWVYGLVLNDDVPFDAAEAIERLAQAGIACRPFFWGMHEQPALNRMGCRSGFAHPVTERLGRRGFYIPSGVALTDDQIDASANAVWQLMGGSRVNA